MSRSVPSLRVSDGQAMRPDRQVHALDIAFVVLIVLIGFLTFFVGFLVAPLIVMALAYVALLIVDRRHHGARSKPEDQP